MQLLRRLGSAGGIGRSRLLRARQSSPLSSSTATAQSSSWSPLWPPDPDSPGHKRAHPDAFEYDLSRARMLDMPSPFVRQGQDPAAPVKVGG